MKTYSKPEIQVRVVVMQQIMAGSVEAKSDAVEANSETVGSKSDGISWESIME